jgi:hypothetical protein
VPGRKVLDDRSLIDPARALLEARENQIVTAVEWDQLRQAVDAAQRNR